MLVAAGAGRRLGSPVPKALADVGGRPLFAHSYDVLCSEPQFSAGVVVAPKGFRSQVARYVADASGRRLATPVTEGGAERQASVRAGLQELPGDVELVLVHDAARPFVSKSLIAACLAAGAKHGAATAALPVTDTIKEVDGGGAVVRTLDRAALRAVQTPQAFLLQTLLGAHERAEREGFAATDDAALVEHYGGLVWTVPGEPNNVKITTPQDLAWARWVILSGEPR